MSAIPAASVSLKTMADGTLRMTFDIEPTQAKDAFSLFAAPGTPVAIVALKTGYAAKSDWPDPDPGLNPMLNGGTVGPLCKWLVMRCNEPEFWAWMNNAFSCDEVTNSHEASETIKFILCIESRKEIDASEKLTRDFHKMIREPYQKWLVRRGVPA